jgi:uncharacterized protein YbjT (DUF2867 family)
MKVVLFGATGMIGQGVLRECLLAPDVDSVVAVGRNPTVRQHPKLHQVTVDDFTDLSPVEGDLAGADACFYCLGITSVGRSEAEYTRVTYDFTAAAVDVLARVNPDLTFVFVSGASTDSTERGRVMWARVKGRAENAVLAAFANGYAFRPAVIQPTHGITSKTRLYRVLYAVTAPVFPVLRRLFPAYVTSTEAIGQAMLRVARQGHPTRILESRDLS